MSKLSLEFVNFSKEEITVLEPISLCFTQRNSKFKGEAAIKKVSKSEMKRLNQDYAGEEKATDVLSFAYQEGTNEDYSAETVGDVAICEEVAVQQAKKHNTSLHNEYAFLITHGLLHVFGFDHTTESEREDMQQLQSEILKCGGFKPPPGYLA